MFADWSLDWLDPLYSNVRFQCLAVRFSRFLLSLQIFISSFLSVELAINDIQGLICFGLSVLVSYCLLVLSSVHAFVSERLPGILRDERT